MPTRQEFILLEPRELDRRLEQAAKLGARQALAEHREYVVELNRSLELAQGLVTKATLCRWLGRSPDTIDHWGIPQDCKRGRQVFYWLPDVIEHLRGQATDETPALPEALQRVLNGALEREP